MEPWLVAVLLFGGLLLALATGLPIAFAFGLVNVFGLFFFFGGARAFSVLAFSGYNSIASFLFVTLPLFILIGDIVFHCGIATRMIDAVGKMVGGGRGSLYYITVVGCTIFGAVSGSTMAATAVFGSVMLPQGKERGYNLPLLGGIIIGVGPLSILIPPSGLMVVFSGISQLSLSKLLMGGIGPGLVIAALFLIYITIRLRLNLRLAPASEESVSLKQRVWAIKDVAPLALIIFAVIGTIYMGIATPTESAALGALAAFVLAALYRQLNWTSIRKSTVATVRISGFILMILLGAQAYGQILAYTGVSQTIAGALTGLPLSPIQLLIAMMVMVIIMGTFMDSTAIMFVAVPIYMPIFQALGFDLLWCGVVMMVAIEIGVITPPFAVNIFVLQGVAPKELTLKDLYKVSIPVTLLHVAGMLVVIAFPMVATFIPRLPR